MILKRKKIICKVPRNMSYKNIGLAKFVLLKGPWHSLCRVTTNYFRIGMEDTHYQERWTKFLCIYLEVLNFLTFSVKKILSDSELFFYTNKLAECLRERFSMLKLDAKTRQNVQNYSLLNFFLFNIEVFRLKIALKIHSRTVYYVYC